MALKYFKDCNVDIAVIEVGLGGRLDCTNIITPLVSVVTNISFDHTQLLGSTIGQIAAEKAGIIKQGVPVVIGESNPESRPVFEAKAQEMGAPITFADDHAEIVSSQPTADGGMDYETRHLGHLHGDLGGLYQAKNLNTVLCVLKELERQHVLPSLTGSDNSNNSCHQLKNSVCNVCKLTGLQGRWQVVSTCPTVICDTGHNVGGWQYLSQQLSQQHCHQMHIIFGMVDDKDINSVLALLPKNARYYFTKADSHRALSEQIVKTLGSQHGLKGEAFQTVKEAYQSAQTQAIPEDFIFVGGSSYVVGDFLKTCF
jgi:dihydrofolate synthase/folylpolyglutamate synthase